MFDKLKKSDKKEEFENLLDGGRDYEEMENVDLDSSSNYEEFVSMDDEDVKFDDFAFMDDGNSYNENSKKKNKINKPVKNKKEKNSFFKKNKKSKKSKNNTINGDAKNADFIDMGNDVSLEEDFVIVGDNSSKMRNFLSSFKVVLSVIVCILLTIIVYLSMSFKIVPENIKGSDYNFGSFSVISRNYQPNLDELKVGDQIVTIDEKLNWLPFTVKYEKFTFESRNGAIIFIKDENGKKHKIQSIDIDYILR